MTRAALVIKVHRFEEDPVILSGTLRSTLNVFDEYDDMEIVRMRSYDADPTLKYLLLSSKRCAVCI